MSKRFLGAIIATLLLPWSIASAEYMSIAEMQETVPARWTQTYETKWRTLEVDAEIRMPDTQAVPIIKVGYPNREPQTGWPIKESGRESFIQTGIEGWDEVETRPISLILSNNSIAVPRSVDGKRINKDAEAAGQWYSDFAPENTYVPMSDITFGEISNMIHTELSRFGYDSKDFQLEMPDELRAQHWYYYGHKKDALPGHIFLQATQKLHGLPYLSHIQQAVSNHNGESRTDELSLYFCGISAGYDGYEERLKHIFINNVEIVETLAEDVPLCSVDQVIRAIEPMIEKGNIRKVYEITLGYVGYNEPGVYGGKRGSYAAIAEQTFYLKPAWQVNCLYVSTAKGKLRETSSYTTDERNTLDYRKFIVDAQTGALIEESRAKDRCEYTGFISWDDVR